MPGDPDGRQSDSPHRTRRNPHYLRTGATHIHSHLHRIGKWRHRGNCTKRAALAHNHGHRKQQRRQLPDLCQWRYGFQLHITFTSSTFSIVKAALRITPDNKTKVYGTSNPALTATYTGLVNGESTDVLSGSLALTTTALDGSNAGNYLIRAAGLTSPNYTITFGTGTLLITKANLVVTANDASRLRGAANPIFTATYNGFVNGDTIASLRILRPDGPPPQQQQLRATIRLHSRAQPLTITTSPT